VQISFCGICIILGFNLELSWFAVFTQQSISTIDALKNFSLSLPPLLSFPVYTKLSLPANANEWFLSCQVIIHVSMLQ